MLKINSTLLILSAAIFYTGCDIERFTSFDHSAKKLQETIKVEGVVTDFNTHSLISRVLVQVGSQQTWTSTSGTFSVNHILNEDDMVNRPVKISLSRHKYYPKEYEEVLIQGKTKFNYTMQRAAPLIDTAIVALIHEEEEFDIEYRCQAIVKDFQGAHTINTVMGEMTFSKKGESPKKVIISLQRIANVSQTESYWQADFSESQLWNFTGRYWLMAFDDEQFVDTLYVRQRERTATNLLF